ncbi:hypothetical protein Mterra_03860 [Calidithermus terrae]|uniref:DUF4342 domain-containing protein n=1 Tax=Calidithermus terrae TaxID=1408545 RepID=A0A399E1Y5_9DEIN|nr:DUF4342 domain-containing protein [Calidithermus terrae]RIH76570.1 hypothetical protein Mterra_03860 [Calidithermus terrae]
MAENPQETKGKTWVEEIEISGGQLVDKVRELVQEGNARRVTVCKPNGEEIFSVPLTVGVLVGGVVTVALPVLAALGVIAGIVTRVRLKVEREEGATTEIREEPIAEVRPQDPEVRPEDKPL